LDKPNSPKKEGEEGERNEGGRRKGVGGRRREMSPQRANSGSASANPRIDDVKVHVGRKLIKCFP
jgi:hypothetical protein